MTGWVTVLRAGALTTIQDEGRPGYAHLGVPRSGSLDRAAHHRANRLVGNPEAAPVLETTLDGVAVAPDVDLHVAVTGAATTVSVDGRASGWSVPIRVRAGERLEVGRSEAGVRSYVAVTGGIRAAPVLGSVSHDLLSGLGPAPLADGDRIALGPAAGPPAPIDIAPYPVPGGSLELVVHEGPRADWLTRTGRETLTTATWTVTGASNRIALRLDGPAVQRARHDELPSEGLTLGAIESLPDGGLVLFLADHPTTGGYPVVAVVDPGLIDGCGQAGPGTRLSFRYRPSPRRPGPAGRSTAEPG